jgi:hypothetical protein
MNKLTILYNSEQYFISLCLQTRHSTQRSTTAHTPTIQHTGIPLRAKTTKTDTDVLSAMESKILFGILKGKIVNLCVF